MKVKVFNPLSGKWSKSIIGVDRDTLVEIILESKFRHSVFFMKKLKDIEVAEDTFKKLDYPMTNIELDFNPVTYREIVDVHYYDISSFKDEDSGEIVDVNRKVKDPTNANYVTTHVSFNNINHTPRTILVSVKNLRRLIEDLKANYGYWIPLIEKIIEMGDIPSDASDDYTLILKFE